MEAIRPHGLSSRTVIHFPSYDQNSGGKRLKSKQNNGAAPMILVQIALCLILASRLTSVQSCGSGKIVFGSTTTVARGMKRVRLLWQRLMPRSVVITGQPGIGVFLSSVTSCALSNNPSCEKVKHFGSLTPSVVVSANRSHFFGMKMATVSYLSGMECFNETTRVSLPVSLRGSYGRSSIRMNAQPVFSED